ncbi:MAG: D-aminoacyl-tRNA deacylase [Polyangiaceae bacterium]|nr:D-aminoacyl-tRNA deacylase [Polyangiaceae bacterium]
MRAVIQRVAWAKVEVDGEVVGAIDRGLLVYLGAGLGDNAEARAYVLSKIIGLRIFDNENGKMDKSVVDIAGALLVVSQFTLYGDVRRGRRPSFDSAMPPEQAEEAYNAFVVAARAHGIRVETGKFRASMKVMSLNDGPVTIWIDSGHATTGGAAQQFAGLRRSKRPLI